MTIPKRVLIIGVLFCLAGLSAVWDIVWAAFHHNVNLNFGVFILPVGIGLLKGRRSSLWWARFWIVLGYVLCAVIVLACTFSPQAAHASWFGHEIRGGAAVPFVVIMGIALAGLLFVMQSLLCSEKARAYLSR